ncbi:PREDICTED: plakophilin-3 [Myotis davidii]|uniref:plakophilin-3 n=1 Tax=Myotis davidii TaxID=225400 RepID=UPI000767A40C|nr:PREDICTED: plakophilin-3 [Myotis davidii]
MGLSPVSPPSIRHPPTHRSVHSLWSRAGASALSQCVGRGGCGSARWGRGMHLRPDWSRETVSEASPLLTRAQDQLAGGASRGQYHTLQTGFSSRSQGLSGDSTSVSDTRASLENLGSAVTWGRLWGRLWSPGSGRARPPLTAIPGRPPRPHPQPSLTLNPCLCSFDDIDLPSAVKYLMASDPNLQVLGAAYIQHKCYSDAAAKKQARSLQAVPRLVKLFNHANQEVQRHATGAMRNLIYDNADNKLALVEENGIFELLRTLREQDDELRKNVTGILWNLSSSDHLKDRLARDTLEQLTDLVLSPLSGAGGPSLIQQNASEAEIFYKATGFLRNLSSASQATRQKMRECHGLVDALVTYINQALDVGKCEDKSVENAVCVLRNLSYRLYDEMPPSALQRLEGRGRRDMNRHTTEAAAGALQNITAGDRRWAGVLAASSLLANLWQYNKLHRDFRAKGYRKEDFLGP